jgi:hypothetical protein
VDTQTQDVSILVVDRVVGATEFPDTFKKPDFSENIFAMLSKLSSTYESIVQYNVKKGAALIIQNEAGDVLGVNLPAGERSLYEAKDGLKNALDFKRTRLTTIRGGETGGRVPDDHIMMLGHQGDKFARNRDDNGVRPGRGAACVVYAMPRTSEREMFDLEDTCLKYIVDDAEAEISRVRPAQKVTDEFCLGNNGFYSIAPFTRPMASVQCIGMTRNYSSGVHGDPDSAPGGYECIMQYPTEDYNGDADFLQFYRHGDALVVVRHKIPTMYSCVLGVGAHMTTMNTVKPSLRKGAVLGIAHIIKPTCWRNNMAAHRAYNLRVFQCIEDGIRPEIVRAGEHAPQAPAAQTPGPALAPPPHTPLIAPLIAPEHQDQEEGGDGDEEEGGDGDEEEDVFEVSGDEEPAEEAGPSRKKAKVRIS